MELLEQMRLEWDEMRRRNAGEVEQHRDGMSKNHIPTPSKASILNDISTAADS